jgi:hypothetical protein
MVQNIRYSNKYVYLYIIDAGEVDRVVDRHHPGNHRIVIYLPRSTWTPGYPIEFGI